MKIYVVGQHKNSFANLDTIREKFFIEDKHSGENIDKLNPWYCELTGLYYLWKNNKDDIIGLEHYRRYFYNDKDKRLISEEDITEILKSYDVIVYASEKYSDNKNTNWHVMKNKFINQYNRFLLIVKSFDDESMYNHMKEYLNTDQIIQNNMFIGKREILNEYFEWLFERLNIYYMSEKHFNILTPRICGYISEYFFGAWLSYKKCKLYNSKQLFNNNVR